MNDTYLTISGLSTGEYSEKRSRFLAFSVPVRTHGEAMMHVARYQKEYHDARHVCYAYMIGPERNTFRVNDNGEPSGTAGKPILGQINSRNLTDILIVVVRYFGGVKLGTGGLIVAYRMAAQAALDNATVVECTVDERITVVFAYPLMNNVMRVVKEASLQIIEQRFDTTCSLTLGVRKSLLADFRNRISAIDGVTVHD